MADEPKAPVSMSSEPVRMLHLPYESARIVARAIFSADGPMIIRVQKPAVGERLGFASLP